jgi:hypothetical protein
MLGNTSPTGCTRRSGAARLVTAPTASPVPPAFDSPGLHRHWRDARPPPCTIQPRWNVQHIGRYVLNGASRHVVGGGQGSPDGRAVR